MTCQLGVFNVFHGFCELIVGLVEWREESVLNWRKGVHIEMCVTSNAPPTRDTQESLLNNDDGSSVIQHISVLTQIQDCKILSESRAIENNF